MSKQDRIRRSRELRGGLNYPTGKHAAAKIAKAMRRHPGTSATDFDLIGTQVFHCTPRHPSAADYAAEAMWEGIGSDED